MRFLKLPRISFISPLPAAGRIPARSRLLWLLAIASVLFLMADTCFHSIYKKQAEVVAFEDADGDGNMDRGEAPIPDTLVVGEFNIHGSFRRSGALTGEDGTAVIEAEYTHFFKIMVVPPCGASATTPSSLDATEGKPLRFGFAPQPQRASSRFQFTLWEDRDGNGVQENGEGLLGSFNLYADPLADSAPNSALYFGSLAVQTDETGRAALDLGNACGNLLVPPLAGWSVTSVIPEPASSAGGLWFHYNAGVAEVTLGLYPIPTPTPYFPTWTPANTPTR
jgi:hypothetical protein